MVFGRHSSMPTIAFSCLLYLFSDASHSDLTAVDYTRIALSPNIPARPIHVIGKKRNGSRRFSTMDTPNRSQHTGQELFFARFLTDCLIMLE